ncbi:MAG: hypothetical protein OCD76_23990, partial [Reichenbachiella sp.]
MKRNLSITLLILILCSGVDLQAQVTLPYYQDFESVADTTYTEDQTALLGLEGWSYSADTEFGRLVIRSIFNNDTRLMALSRVDEFQGGMNSNDAILTIDLSEYSVVTDDVLIDFRFFKVTHAESIDDNKIYVRGDEVNDWVVLYDWQANDVSGDEWVSVHALSIRDSLLAYTQEYSSTFQLRFRQVGGSSSNLRGFYLDDLNIYEYANHDVKALKIETPTASASLSATETITVNYFNNGATTETFIPLTVWLDGPQGRQVVNETVNKSLDAGDTLIYTFSSSFDFSIVGNYKVTVFSELANDPNVAADTIRDTTEKWSVYLDKLPYFEDFELISDTTYAPNQGELLGLNGWSYNGSNNDCVLSLDNSLELGRTNYEFGYTSNDVVLTMDLSMYTVLLDNILLDFRFTQSFPNNRDHNQVFVRGNQMSDWIELYNWYDNRGERFEWLSVLALTISDSLAAHDQEYSTTFQLRFGEEANIHYDKFILDDVKVYRSPFGGDGRSGSITPSNGSVAYFGLGENASA